MSQKRRVIFAHDHRFVLCGGKFHSRGGLPEAVLQRYSSYFGSLAVVCRVEHAETISLAPIDRDDIEFFPQPDMRRVSNLASLSAVRRNVGQLVAGADAVIARLPSIFGWLAAHEARRQGKPYLLEIVGNAREASRLHGSKLGSVIGIAIHQLTKREARLAPQAVYITDHYLQGIYPTRGVQYICPNVSISGRTDDEFQAALQSFPRQAKPRIGLIGSLDVNYKGHDVAFDVLARLIREHDLADVSLHLAGGGAQERWKDLAKAYGIESQVTFCGSIRAGATMNAWIDEMDMMLQPSLTEGQGRGIIEAMSRGKPVVASHVGGIVELLTPEWMTAPRDAAGLAQRCARLLNDAALYRDVARRNLNRARDFSPERIDAVRLKAFASLLGETPPKGGQDAGGVA